MPSRSFSSIRTRASSSFNPYDPNPGARERSSCVIPTVISFYSPVEVSDTTSCRIHDHSMLHKRCRSGTSDHAVQRTLKLSKELLIGRGCAALSYMFLCSLANAL